jgi:HSP20 family protein
MFPELFHRPRFSRPRLTIGSWDPFATLPRLIGLLDEDAWPARPPDFRVDVREDDANYYLDAELPGLDRENVDVTVKDGVLTVEANSDTDTQRSGDGYHLRERRVGQFARSLSLPDNVDVDKITADIKKGVLTVTLPKTAAAKPKRIDIQVQ